MGAEKVLTMEMKPSVDGTKKERQKKLWQAVVENKINTKGLEQAQDQVVARQLQQTAQSLLTVNHAGRRPRSLQWEQIDDDDNDDSVARWGFRSISYDYHVNLLFYFAM